MLNFSPEARWIEHPSCPADTAPVFTKSFTLKKSFKSAKLLICGIGFYKALINQSEITDTLLDPPFTAYDKRCYYNCYDVEGFLKEGENTITVTLGNGWYNQQEADAWNFNTASWKASPQLICELICDGESVLLSDSSWQCTTGAIVFNSLRGGESYNATLGYSPFNNASVSHGPGGELIPFEGTPIRVTELIKPAETEKYDRHHFYDFKAAISGNVHIKVKGERGTKVKITYGERRTVDANLNTSEIKSCMVGRPRFQTDEYILSGNGEEEWHSIFCYHGFSMVVIYTKAEVLDVTARVFHTDLKKAGSFICDDPLVTKLQSAILRSTRTNFHHMPTDCPHREKNGWTGDAALSCLQTIYNFDVKAAHLKYLDDIVDSQRPNGAISCIVPNSGWGHNWGTGTTWDYVLFEIAWQNYLFSGETKILEKYAPAMKKYLIFMDRMSDNGVWKNGLGDWCPAKNCAVCSTPALLTAYAHQCYAVYAKVSKALKNSDEELWANKKASEVRSSFIKNFADSEDRTLTFLAASVAFGLSDEPQKLIDLLEEEIIKGDYHPNCGIFGIKLLFNTLADWGKADLAWKVIHTSGYPSFEKMLQIGADSLTEEWHGKSSLNHHMYSSVGDFFYRSIAGIHPDEDHPGFEKLTLRPRIPAELKAFSCSYPSPKGLIKVELKASILSVSVPDGVDASLELNGKLSPFKNSLEVNL